LRINWQSVDPRVRKNRNKAFNCPGIFFSTLRFSSDYVASSTGSPLPHLLDGHRKLVRSSVLLCLSQFQQGRVQYLLYQSCLSNARTGRDMVAVMIFFRPKRRWCARTRGWMQTVCSVMSVLRACQCTCNCSSLFLLQAFVHGFTSVFTSGEASASGNRCIGAYYNWNIQIISGKDRIIETCIYINRAKDVYIFLSFCI